MLQILILARQSPYRQVHLWCRASWPMLSQQHVELTKASLINLGNSYDLIIFKKRIYA